MARRPAPASRSFLAIVRGDPGSVASAIDLPFDPKEAFGKARAPVVVELNGYTYRTTTFTMVGARFVPLRQSHRDAAGVRVGQRVRVTMTLDDQPRTVDLPDDLRAALAEAGVLEAFQSLSYTHQREHVEAIEQARKPETRAKRLAACLEAARARAAEPARPAKPARTPTATKPAAKTKAGATPKRRTGRVVD